MENLTIASEREAGLSNNEARRQSKERMAEKREANKEVAVSKQSHDHPENWKELFLGNYAESGNKQYSAIMAGINVRSVYNHIKSDPEFALAVEEARQIAIYTLHMEARARAMGEPILDEDGNEIGRRRASDKLLIFLLSSMSPEEYGHGAISAAQRRSESKEDGAMVRISLPENFRGTVTIEGDRHDLFPDADILDAEFIDSPDESVVEIEGSSSS